MQAHREQAKRQRLPPEPTSPQKQCTRSSLNIGVALMASLLVRDGAALPASHLPLCKPRSTQLYRTCYRPPCQALVQQGCQLLLTGYLHLSSTCGVNTCCAWRSSLQLLHTISGCGPAVPFVNSHWWCCEDSLLSNVLRVHQISRPPPPANHTHLQRTRLSADQS